jgi:hypothetical protein
MKATQARDELLALARLTDSIIDRTGEIMLTAPRSYYGTARLIGFHARATKQALANVGVTALRNGEAPPRQLQMSLDLGRPE